jgi:hypothetical protein
MLLPLLLWWTPEAEVGVAEDEAEEILAVPERVAASEATEAAVLRWAVANEVGLTLWLLLAR